MLAITTSVAEFARLNGDEMRYIVANLCVKHKVQNVDDMVQEVYAWFIEKDILKRFNPNYNGKKVKLSTFLYSVVENVIRGKKDQNESQVSRSKFIPPSRKYQTGGQYVDDVELALRYNDMAIEYETIIEQNNISDSLEGLGSEIQDFEERFLPLENKVYTLSRRRDKGVMTSGTTLVEVFKLFRQGYSSREISRKFGISDMFVSNMKGEIAEALRAYGLGSKKAPKRKKRRKKSVA